MAGLVKTSPIPLPDASVFDTPITFSNKRKTSSSGVQCPSPPTKSPPVSRFFGNTLYTPHAQQILPHTPHSRGLSRRFSSSPDTNTFSTTPRSDDGSNDFELRFETVNIIGKGSFGEVYHVVDRKSREAFAVKKRTKAFSGEGDRQRAIQEAKIGRDLSPHPHTLHYYDAWQEKGFLFIQTELAETSLKEYLDSHDNTGLPEEIIWDFLLDAVLGLKHIHNRGYLHMDIKPGNFLIKDGSLKIGDYGLTIPKAQWRQGIEGDSRYVAPELLSDTRSIGPPADVFSLGATFFEMAANVEMPTGQRPWQLLRAGAKISEMPDAPKRSNELEDIIFEMMRPNPSERITLERLLRHPSLASLLEQRGGSPSSIEASPRVDSIQDTSMEMEDDNSLFAEDEFENDDSDLHDFEMSLRLNTAERKKEERAKQRRESLEEFGIKFEKFPILDLDSDDEGHELNSSPVMPKNLMSRFDMVTDR